ncbi:hypothetical protein Q1695_002611 [Nippostrongylus brasiliensis]|nr:hypothetical protein Q1695_002611 [Nippostrongylus brasiliensis]
MDSRAGKAVVVSTALAVGVSAAAAVIVSKHLSAARREHQQLIVTLEKLRCEVKELRKEVAEMKTSDDVPKERSPPKSRNRQKVTVESATFKRSILQVLSFIECVGHSPLEEEIVGRRCPEKMDIGVEEATNRSHPTLNTQTRRRIGTKRSTFRPRRSCHNENLCRL